MQFEMHWNKSIVSLNLGCDVGCRLMAEGAKVGFPVLVKAALGGGGKGMKLAMQQDELEVCFYSCRMSNLHPVRR